MKRKPDARPGLLTALRRVLATAAGVLLASAALSAGATPRRLVIIDQDAYGGVDLQPILMLIQDPSVRILGITIESGDGWQKESTAQALRMLELIGRTDIPVAAGATYPLVNSEEATERWEALYGQISYLGAWMKRWPGPEGKPRAAYHGPDVVPPLPQGLPTTHPVPESAARFMVEEVRKHPGQVSILGLGPFTNIALATQLDPKFARSAEELVIMGASFNPAGAHPDEFSREFINSPRVEFNCRWDPEAARIMLHAGWRKIVVVPVDATVGTALPPDLVREAGSSDSPASRYYAKYGDRGYPMWDETASAVWLEPSIVTESDLLAMDIDIDHGADYGGTLSWHPGFNPGLGEPIVTVVRDVNIPELHDLFVANLCRTPPPP